MYAEPQVWSVPFVLEDADESGIVTAFAEAPEGFVPQRLTTVDGVYVADFRIADGSAKLSVSTPSTYTVGPWCGRRFEIMAVRDKNSPIPIAVMYGICISASNPSRNDEPFGEDHFDPAEVGIEVEGSTR